MGKKMSVLLEIKNLSISYSNAGKELLAVEGVNLSMKEGSILGIVGESGCGKTTLAMSIARLLPENAQILSGEIIYRGKDVLKLNQKQLSQIRGKEVGYIFQDPTSALNPVMSIGEQLIETITQTRKLSTTEAIEEVYRLLSLVKIPHPKEHMKFYPHQLSGGLNQRVMIALALASKPALLIADEPTSNLDVTIEASIVELLFELKQSLNLSVIFITHDLSLVRLLADETVVVKAGKILELNKTSLLFSRPQEGYTKELVQASLINML